MRKKLFLAFAAVALLSAAVPASADTVLFDPTGSGSGYIPISGFDWAPGNGIAVGASAASNVGDSFNFYYQANLAVGGIFQDEDGPNVSTGGNYFTVVIGIRETVASKTVTPSSSGPVTTLGFGLDTSSTAINFFQIWSNPGPAPSNTTGVCFICGTLVLEGDVLLTGYQSSFSTLSTVDPLNPNLDSAGAANDYPGVLSISGSGQTDLRIGVSYVNSNYLLGAAGSTIVFGVANAVGAGIPFDFSNPSACFMATGIVGTAAGTVTTAGNQCTGAGAFEGVASVGAVNGLGTNTMLEIDGNTTFETVATAVPEPATLSLLGLGLIGAAAMRRRSQRRK